MEISWHSQEKSGLLNSHKSINLTWLLIGRVSSGKSNLHLVLYFLHKSSVLWGGIKQLIEREESFDICTLARSFWQYMQERLKKRDS